MGKFKHGHGKKAMESPTYITWKKMRERCGDPNNNRYQYYGGKGVRVCDRWQNSFSNFFADMGERPEGMSLDRVENNLHYDKENCRWADSKTQARHGKRYVEFNGKKQTLAEWGAELGIKRRTLSARLHVLKWPLDRVLAEKVLS